MSLCVHVCVFFSGGLVCWKNHLSCVCVTHSFLQWHVSKNPIPPHSPPKTNNTFWTKREMIILSNVHLAHVCACVCVYTKQEIFIFQWHFAKETSNSISYCKERNLHFIITFLHEKRAQPLALVHIATISSFSYSKKTMTIHPISPPKSHPIHVIIF